MTRGHRQFADAAVDENGLYRPDDAAHSPVSLLCYGVSYLDRVNAIRRDALSAAVPA